MGCILACVITRRICRRLELLTIISPSWAFHLKLFWSVRPNTLCDWTLSRSTRSIVRLGVHTSKRRWPSFCTFVVRCPVFNLIKCCLDVRVSLIWPEWPQRLLNRHHTSSMKMEILIWDRWPLKGTVTLNHWQTSLLSFTRWRRSVRKLHIHRIMEGRTPKATIFFITREWLIRSKAIEKSSTHALRYFPGWYRADNQLWVRSRRQ